MSVLSVVPWLGGGCLGTAIQQHWEEDVLWNSGLTYSAFCDERNVASGDAQVVQFAVRQAVKFVTCLANPVPGANATKDIHVRIPLKSASTFLGWP